MQAVRWSEEVVDNEFMNKKKSKSESASVAHACGIVSHDTVRLPPATNILHFDALNMHGV